MSGQLRKKVVDEVGLTWPQFLAAKELAYGFDKEAAKEAAREVAGVKTVRTIENWEKNPAFARVVTSLRAEAAKKVIEAAEETSLLKLENRIKILNSEEEAFATIIEERAKVAPEGVPGASTGRLRTIVKEHMNEEGVTTVTEHVIDKDLVTLRRENAMAAERMATGLNKAADGEERVVYEFVAD